MTIDSLINFGVPGISGKRSAPLQPIIRNKFRVMFSGIAKSEESYVMTQQIRSVTLPQINRVKVMPPTTIDFYDDITTGAFGMVLAQCDRQKSFNEVDAYFQMKIELIAGMKPDILRTYEFTNCLIETTESMTLDYSEATAMQFSITVSHSFLHIYDGEMKRLW